MNINKNLWLIIALLIVLAGVFHLCVHQSGHIWGGDFAMYVLHARNLVEGVPFAETGYIYNGTVEFPGIGPRTYPPGCPVMLAPVYWCYGLDLAAMKWMMVGSFLVFLAVLALCFRRQLTPTELIALVALVGFNHFFVDLTGVINSDIPFLALVYLVILLVETAYADNSSARRKMICLLASGLVMYLAFATRTIGVLLAPTLLLRDWLHSRRVSRDAVLALGIFGGLLLLQSMTLHSGGSYADHLRIGFGVLPGNAVDYLTRMAAFWRNGYFQSPAGAIFLGVTGLAVLGYVDTVRRKITFPEVFFAIYTAFIFLWPCYQGERFLLPVIPLWVFYALRGLSHPWIARRERLAKGLFAAIVLAAVVSYAAHYSSIDYGPMKEGIEKTESVELFKFIDQTADRDDVVVFVKPRVIALYGSCRGAAYPQTSDDRVWEYLDRIEAKYVIVVENDDAFLRSAEPDYLAFLREFVGRNSERFERLFANDDFSVYRIILPR